jgi:D-psicose/D-tagatose/L-ribulose 3-epimerase
MTAAPDIYLSFFMFTADLRPGDPAYAKVIAQHIRELRGLGYKGFDMPVFPAAATGDPQADVEGYRELVRSLRQAGLDDVGFTTNVAAMPAFDPTSDDPAVRDAALAYLKSRVDITAVLGGDIMAGPIVFPYNVYPAAADGQPIWSDALQDWAAPRYRNAQPVLDAAGEYAASRGVRLAIEPVDHWEQSAPNMVGDVLDFLDGVPSRQVGVCLDIAHVVLGSSGPEVFKRQVGEVAEAGRLNYVQVSPPDRGTVSDSWIPWGTFLPAVLPRYSGPLLIEIFNAIQVFLTPLHITRRKFWIPGEDEPRPGVPDAYTVAAESIEALEKELSRHPRLPSVLRCAAWRVISRYATRRRSLAQGASREPSPGMRPGTGTRAPGGAVAAARSAGEPMLLYLIKQLELAIRSKLDDLVHPVGLTTAQYTALTVLERHADMSSAQLARNSFVTAQSMADIITALEGRGLIERHRDVADRRRLVVALTPTGRELLEVCRGPVRALEARMLGGLSEPEIAGFRHELRACRDNLSGRKA